MDQELTAEVKARIEAEARRRGLAIDDLVAELLERPVPGDVLDAFIGSGSSGRHDLAQNHRAIRAEEVASGAVVDASYEAYEAHPLDEADEWGDLASFRAAAGAS